MDGRDMDPGARQELNLCEDMCRQEGIKKQSSVDLLGVS